MQFYSIKKPSRQLSKVTNLENFKPCVFIF